MREGRTERKRGEKSWKEEQKRGKTGVVEYNSVINQNLLFFFKREEGERGATRNQTQGFISQS